MFYPGLVSISFRDHTPAKIALAAYKFGLKYIEWGSDIHAPCGDIKQLQFIAGLHSTFDISCCSYGTYFRLGHSPISELHQYIEAAKILGTNILRLWAGRKKAADCTKEERDFLFSECRKAAAIAEEHNVILCLECHRRSYTETKEGALELMQEINSPNLRMYWQPNPDISLEDNLDYITSLDPYITHVHVFNWSADQRYIAVSDLTKMSDIVRNRTYEAFFPLISTAVIYFAITGMLIALVKRIEIKFDPKRRTPEQIVSGIQIKEF